MSRQLPWIAAIVVPCAVAAVIHSYWPASEPVPQKPPAVRRAVFDSAPPAPELPPSEPSAAVPTLVESGRAAIELRERALATELSKMWTKNPDELVTVIDQASRSAAAGPPVTLLLAIAHAETNGKILDVSEAGAVGLAQATPIAIRQEEFDGKMFVTSDYLLGSRAYIMKKPLGDADTIASLIVAHDDARSRARAKRLLKSAFDLRREGVDELELLAPFATKKYDAGIRSNDEHNLRTLQHLRRLLDKGNKRQIRAFRDQVRREYRGLKQTQVQAWTQYMHDLIDQRDRMLVRHFGMSAAEVKRTMPYEAGEYLGRELDLRFSAKKMSAFLVRHLERKAEEARKLASPHADVEEMTAALYNGGSHNVKRMIAGLIASLPETQRYMKKVPATRRRLDRSIVLAGGIAEPTLEQTLR